MTKSITGDAPALTIPEVQERALQKIANVIAWAERQGFHNSADALQQALMDLCA